MLTAIAAGAMLALVHVGHCAGMCGPLSCAVCGRTVGSLARYQGGRIAGYALFGALSGHLGRALGVSLQSATGVWMLALLTAAACTFSAWRLLAGSRQRLFTIRRPQHQRRGVFASLQRLIPREPMFVGMLTALLPCGVLASAVLAAGATGNGAEGAGLMITFAAISGMAVWSASLISGPVARRFGARVRWTVAGALVLTAALALARPIRALSEPQASAAHHLHCH